MTAITYLILNTDGSIETKSGVLGVKDAQDILGSDFEMLPEPPGLPITLIASTEGKSRGDNPNWGATRLIRNSLRAGDFVAGKVIVTGAPNAAGDLTALTVKDEQEMRNRISTK